MTRVKLLPAIREKSQHYVSKSLASEITNAQFSHDYLKNKSHWLLSLMLSSRHAQEKFKRQRREPYEHHTAD